MQPQRAVRSIAAVALSSAGIGILLLALALLLSACGSSSKAAPTSASSAPSTADSAGPAPTGASSPAPATSGAPTTAPPTTGTAATEDPTDSIVPSVPITTAPAVPLTAAASTPGGGAITIGTITSIQGTAQLPGEIAGPAVRVPVTMRNGSGAPINLEQVVVDLVDHAGASAGQLTASPAQPFTGTLAPGATAQAVYVFTLATNDRAGISIVVSYTTTAPVVVFTGTVA